MTITIQEGIDASSLRQAIYETIRAGMECDAAAARKRHEERMAIIRRGGGASAPAAAGEQPSLFD